MNYQLAALYWLIILLHAVVTCTAYAAYQYIYMYMYIYEAG